MKTKSPLSLLLFCRRNIVKLLPFLVITLFSVFAIITSTALLNSWNDTAQFYESFIKKSAIITYFSQFPNPTNLLKKNKSILNVYSIEAGSDSVKLLGGYIPYMVIGVKKEDIKDIMKYYGVSIKYGRIFSPKAKEIILSEEIVKNKELELGKHLKEHLSDFKLVGILEGKTALGIYQYQPQKIANKRTNWVDKLVVFRKPSQYKENIRELQKVQDEYTSKYRQHFSYWAWNESREKSIKEIQEDIQFMSNISLIISIVVFSLIAVFLNIVYFQDRVGEYGLLLSLGLSKFQIIKKAFWESFLSVFFSWVIGVVLSKVVLEILQEFVSTKKGWFLETFPIDALPNTIFIPLGMFICGLLVVIYKIQKLDPIEIIERRW